MGQFERPSFSVNDSFFFEDRNTANNQNISNNGIVFDNAFSMGNNSFSHTAGHQQSANSFLIFLSRLGGYNVYNLYPDHKKMATLLIKLSFYLANLFGISLIVYFLTIDLDGIKIFLTSVGAITYAGLKIYEKYLDVKEKRRKDKANDKYKNGTDIWK